MPSAKLHHEEVEQILSELLVLMNRDKDGDYFLCREAEPLIDRANQLLFQTLDPT